MVMINNYKLIRPPGAVVPEGLIFYKMFIFLFISPQDLRAP